MWLSHENFQNLVNVGAILYLVCFLFRDQIALRCFAMAGDVIYTLFYYGAGEQPYWHAMYWSIINFSVNAVMIWLIIRDTRPHNLSDNELKLYRNLGSLTPGEFRRLVALGKWETASVEATLTTEGQALDKLYYVLEGELQIDKSGRQIEVKPGLFIGEIAYLLQKPATATVKVKPGTVYVAWSRAALAKAFEKQEGLKHSLSNLLSADLAEKVARS
jgi:hypothetical protein